MEDKQTKQLSFNAEAFQMAMTMKINVMNPSM